MSADSISSPDHGERGLLDTSVFIAQESGRRIDVSLLPDEGYVSVITLAELEAGVLAASDQTIRSRRLATLTRVSALVPLQVDATAAAHWARMRVQLAESGRRVNVNDLWIAAVALANGLAVYTQDHDYDPLAELGELRVITV
ncbi:type II toxin-antitoxin system VapC family toxin [Propionimicrobium sp. PCR01-08-3]|uniref:type II toxin-antitoxin system VapC family toxin n=1 Tax=Propionimicrobium sp. PCR01-08-3 TaxID=3052086 RepID=UPI00255D08D4|nr:type II toxin-antitoxin system VapC family toxin [Propionimicrobium sp. PCR01-08-3]WIY82175.1 type II toxin-antitoxin system VapC family toxin [Propionimicrobium sp. PCR01-08-3]